MRFLSKLKHSRKRQILFALFVAGLIWFVFALPSPLFSDPISTVIEDESGHLLGARLAQDEQWRFPLIDSVPKNFAQAITTYEDKRFYSHFGVDLRSISRAIKQNLSSNSVVSGASTLDMQVIRLSRKRRKATIWKKLIESLLAIRLDLKYPKKDVLRYYASYAPFGGNIVGLEAAAWRYFGKSPHQLSMSQAAVLAVLPNNPSLVRPGKNEATLLRKRNKLLDKLYKKNVIDSITCQLGKEEPLPGKPLPLPSIAPHLLNLIYAQQSKDSQARFRTTIKRPLQQKMNRLVDLQLRRLKASEVNNCSILILDVETGNTLAYVGNAIKTGGKNSPQVDMNQANRSTGSTLKPILSCLAFDDGLVTPKSLLRDIPSQFGRYHPENFNHNFSGVIPLDQALIRSLNIPFVRLLRSYGISKFHHSLQELGLKSLVNNPDYYGLTLILGGAEVSPWEMGSCYASMARTLAHFYEYDGQYDINDIHPARYLAEKKKKTQLTREAPVVSAGAIWSSFKIMKELRRPNIEGNWKRFGTGRPIAWKTGTSIGFRDAWAVGLDRKYVVVVWTGNANGVGRAGLTGLHMAAPILFDVFKQLPKREWFDVPHDELVELQICKESGFLPKETCPKDTITTVQIANDLPICTYHKNINIDPKTQKRVTRNCAEGNLLSVTKFSLRPIEAYFYKAYHPDYQGLPPFQKGCEPADYHPMQLIYPRQPSKIYVPVSLSGQKEKTVFEVAYDYPEQILYWHLDKKFIGQTQHFHQMPLDPPVGKHTLTIVDKDGHRLVQYFEILPSTK